MCERGDYAADVESPAASRAPDFPERLDGPLETAAGVTTIDALAAMLGIDSAATSKAMPVTAGRHRRARPDPR